MSPRPRWALTPPFHPCLIPCGPSAVCFLLRRCRIAPPGRYPAPCPMESGLSSSLLRDRRPPARLPHANRIIADSKWLRARGASCSAFPRLRSRSNQRRIRGSSRPLPRSALFSISGWRRVGPGRSGMVYRRVIGAAMAFRPVAVGVGGAELGAPMSQGAYRRVCGAATPKGAAQRGCSATGPANLREKNRGFR